MSYLAVELALYERLVGAPLDSTGKPQVGRDGVPVNRHLIGPPNAPENMNRLPSYGVRIPLVMNPRPMAELKPALRVRDFSRTSFKTIPVFPVNQNGVDWADIWPCVSFYWMDEEPNASTYIYADPFITDAPTAPVVNVVNRNDVTIASGKLRSKYRQHPDAYDLYFLIRAWSKNVHELMMICNSIKELFPMRTALEVEQADGTRAVFDMMLERIENLDTNTRELDAVMESEQRGFSRGFVYKIESYVDNTADAFSTWEDTVIRSRILELANQQASIIENVGPVDLIEAEPIDED